MKPFPGKSMSGGIGLAVSILFIFWFFGSACKKIELPKPDPDSKMQAYPECVDCNELEMIYSDSLDHTTILGGQISNPYSLSVMTEAYHNIYGEYPRSSLKANYLYVKFSPKDFGELDQLEEEDLPLYDFPLDQVEQMEGEYYVQPGKGIEDLPEYFTVVRADYPLPKGISHQVLEPLYIPDDEPKLEDEALRLTNNLEDGNDPSGSGFPGKDRPVTEDQSDPRVMRSGNESCNHYASGRILVQDHFNTDQNYRGVRQVKVTVRRLFKIETLFTDDQGNFQGKKYFRNKFRVEVKFRNSYARVSRMRSHALREQFFPISINFGKWSNLDCGHEFRIKHPLVAGTIATSHWCAAMVQNGVLEFREMAKQEGIGMPPQNLNIMLSSKKGSGNGNTYMLNKILKTEGAVGAAQALITVVVTAWTPIASGLFNLAVEAYKVRSPDIKYGYGGDPSFLTTDRYDELIYHELAHSAHYGVVGNHWWLKLGIAENKNPGTGTYGDCCSSYSPCIALAEGWAYFIGHYFADKKWKGESTPFPEQGDLKDMIHYLVFSPLPDLSSHLNFLEGYQPNRPEDPNRWIPKGLMYDLIDPAEEKVPGSGITDQVAGYTASQIFHAMQSDVDGMEAYKARLLEQNRNDQESAVENLFASYGY